MNMSNAFIVLDKNTHKLHIMEDGAEIGRDTVIFNPFLADFARYTLAERIAFLDSIALRLIYVHKVEPEHVNEMLCAFYEWQVSKGLDWPHPEFRRPEFLGSNFTGMHRPVHVLRGELANALKVCMAELRGRALSVHSSSGLVAAQEALDIIEEEIRA